MAIKTEISEQIDVIDANELMGTVLKYTTYHSTDGATAPWLAGRSFYKSDEGRDLDYLEEQDIFLDAISGRIWRKM